VKPYRVHFNGYVVAVDQPAALAAAKQIQDMAALRGIAEAQCHVSNVTERDLMHLPVVRRLLDRYTAATHGPVCSIDARLEALRAIAAASDGDVDRAEAVLRALEQTMGYLPRDIADRLTTNMLELATRPEAA
jgi:hypothetical protein